MIAEIVLVAASYHFHRRGQNEDNPGYGLNLVHAAAPAWSTYVGGARYMDSYNDHANGVVAGVRYDLGPWAGLDLGVGYGRCHTYEGFVVLPAVYAGTDRVKAVVTLLGNRALGFSVRVSL